MPKLVFHDSDMIERTIDIGADPIMIGRATECQVQTQDAMVSRRHARIIWDGGYWIEDLGSSNGVYIAGDRIQQRTPVRPGDEVRCGSLMLKLLPDVPSRGGTGVARPVNPAPPPAYGAPPPVYGAPPPAYGAPPPAFGAPPPAAPGFGAPPPYAPPPTAYDPAPDPARRATVPTPALQPAPVAPPTLAPPPTAAPAAGASASQEVAAERSRRIQAEAAVLSAEQRATTAEAKYDDAVARAREAENRVLELEQKVAQGGAAPAAATPGAMPEVDKLKRKIEQLTSEIRRLRGGGPVQSEDDTSAMMPAAALGDITAERDRLKQRVTDLQAEVERLEKTGGGAAATAAVAAPAAAPDPDSSMLRRKVEQLTAEVRRLRGGGAPGPAPDDGKVAELEQRLAAAERERDEARRQAADAAAKGSTPAAAAAVDDRGPEIEKMKRMIEQLTAENRRMRQGAAAPPEDPRVADLTARLDKAEADLKAARATPAATAGPKMDAGTADVVNSLNDVLSDLRGSLRAANDEIGVLTSEATSSGAQESVGVMRDSITSSTEQLEDARNKLRELKKLLGVT